VWVREFQRDDGIVGRWKQRVVLVLKEKSCSRWVRAKWGASDVTERGREEAGLTFLKLLQHLLVSLKADKWVLFKEATTLWETLDQDYTKPFQLSRDFTDLLTDLVRSILSCLKLEYVVISFVVILDMTVRNVLSFKMLLAVKSIVRSMFGSYCFYAYNSAVHWSSTW